MLESHRDTEIAASPLAAAGKDLNAMPQQLTSLGDSCWREIHPLRLRLHCVLINFAHNTAAVCSCNLKYLHAIPLSYTFQNRCRGNYTLDHTQLIILTVAKYPGTDFSKVETGRLNHPFH